MRRLLGIVIGCIIVGYGLVVVAFFVDLPTALVCEREEPKSKLPQPFREAASRSIV